MKYETRTIHGGRPLGDEGFVGPSFPIYNSSTFVQEGLNNYSDFMYTRCGNPTRNNLEELFAQLEGADHAFALASGMAAISLAFSLIKPGEKVLLNSNIYGGTWNYVLHFFENNNIECEIVHDFNNYDFENVEENVSTVFIETPSNPLLEITDIKAVSEKAKAKGLRVIVDNTFMTSYLQKPLALGADIVVGSATKYYAGHSDVIAGFFCFNGDELFEELRTRMKCLGAALDPISTFLVTRGIKTLPLRMDKQQDNAMKIAEYFENSDAVEAVHYPGLPNHPGHELQMQQANGHGACLSVEFKETYDLDVMCRELRYFDLAVSLGGVESLVCHPATMTHEEYSEELQAEIGITQQLLRFAIGVEAIEDLIEDLDQAIAKAKK